MQRALATVGYAALAFAGAIVTYASAYTAASNVWYFSRNPAGFLIGLLVGGLIVIPGVAGLIAIFAKVPPTWALRAKRAAPWIVVAIVVFLVVGTLDYLKNGGRHSPARTAEAEMRANLRSIANAQDAYFAEHRKFGLDSADRARYAVLGVTIDAVDSVSWHATARHRAITRTCDVSGNKNGHGGVTCPPQCQLSSGERPDCM